jgi:hypothetical protein
MPSNFNQPMKTKIIDDFIKHIANTEVSYYIGFGKYDQWANDSSPPNSNTSIQAYHYDVQRDLIFGKKVIPDDVAPVTRKITWKTGTVYAQYDNRDSNLYYKNFYVINSSNRVYKCLYNNNGALSTVMPEGDGAIGDLNLQDGYKWKYLYSLSSAQIKKFNTPELIPVFTDSTVKTNAKAGAIHACNITNRGSGYISANGNIENQLFDENGEKTIFKVSNTTTSDIAGIYNTSTFIAGNGKTTLSFATINEYKINTSGRYVITKSPVTDISQTIFTISPQVLFTGDGYEAYGISEVDPLHGEIKNIKMISQGAEYSYCTASIIANSFYGSGATAYPIIPPKGGHGSNTMFELGCKTFGISLSTSSQDNFLDWYTYRQVSLLYNPVSPTTGNIYKNNTFTNITKISFTDVLTNSSTKMTIGEVVRGVNSGATGTVVYMDNTALYLKGVDGDFLPYESVTNTTGIRVSIANINNSSIKPYSAEVLYYKNMEPISRIGITTEQAKIYFSI